MLIHRLMFPSLPGILGLTKNIPTKVPTAEIYYLGDFCRFIILPLLRHLAAEKQTTKATIFKLSRYHYAI